MRVTLEIASGRVDFVLELLKQLDGVTAVSVKNENTTANTDMPDYVLSEKSLAKEWLSKEDDCWDAVL